MAFARSHGSSQLDYAHDNENDWPSMAEIERPEMCAVEEKQNANGDQHRGPHEAADGAALAVTMNAVAHWLTSFRCKSKNLSSGPKAH
jgi:hypothetical protein